MNHCKIARLNLNILMNLPAMDTRDCWFICLSTQYNMKECENFSQAEWESNGIWCKWLRDTTFSLCTCPAVQLEALTAEKLEEL